MTEVDELELQVANLTMNADMFDTPMELTAHEAIQLTSVLTKALINHRIDVKQLSNMVEIIKWFKNNGPEGLELLYQY